jgi:hypothetical protein
MSPLCCQLGYRCVTSCCNIVTIMMPIGLPLCGEIVTIMLPNGLPMCDELLQYCDHYDAKMATWLLVGGHHYAAIWGTDVWRVMTTGNGMLLFTDFLPILTQI